MLESIAIFRPPRNTKNQVNAVTHAVLGPRIACFVHVINLASLRKISVNQMDRLPGRRTKVVFGFNGVLQMVAKQAPMIVNGIRTSLIV